jgi:hypothetical protein
MRTAMSELRLTDGRWSVCVALTLDTGIPGCTGVKAASMRSTSHVATRPPPSTIRGSCPPHRLLTWAVNCRHPLRVVTTTCASAWPHACPVCHTVRVAPCLVCRNPRPPPAAWCHILTMRTLIMEQEEEEEERVKRMTWSVPGWSNRHWMRRTVPRQSFGA